MKKKLLIGALAALMVMPISVSVASAATSFSIGSPVATATKDWGKYSKYQYTTGGTNAQRAFIGEYDVKDLDDYEFVVHNVLKSDGTPKLQTVKQIADNFTQTTGRKVVMATNGDYFSFDTGVQVSALVKEGQVYSTWYTGGDTPKHDYGFDNKGNFAIGQMKAVKEVVRVTVEGVTYEIDVDKTNAVPADGEVSLYTTAYQTSIPGTKKFKYQAGSDNLSDRPLSGTCKNMQASSALQESLTLNGGQFALVTKGDSKAAQFLTKYATYNTTCEIITAPSGDFTGMQYVVGGWEALVVDGVKQDTSKFHSSNSGSSLAPRTVVGNKADGSMFLLVCDGRGTYAGHSVSGLADLAVNVGAENALEMDGGGSSTFWYDLGSGLQLLNTPSDGSQRSVSNAVLLVEKGEDAVEYTSVENWVAPGGSTSSGSNSSGSNLGSSETGSSETGSSAEEGSGCFGSVGFGSVGIFVAAAFVCAKALKNKENKDGGNKDEQNV